MTLSEISEDLARTNEEVRGSGKVSGNEKHLPFNAFPLVLGSSLACLAGGLCFVFSALRFEKTSLPGRPWAVAPRDGHVVS